jgi:hypothetical protein
MCDDCDGGNSGIDTTFNDVSLDVGTADTFDVDSVMDAGGDDFAQFETSEADEPVSQILGTPETEVLPVEDTVEQLEVPEEIEGVTSEDLSDVNAIMDAGEDDFEQFDVADEVVEVPVETEPESADVPSEEPSVADELVEAPTEAEPENVEVLEVDEKPNIDETQINYDEIYEIIEQEALAEGFSHINIENDPERLTSSLDNFNDETWQNLSLDEQKDSINNLSDYVSEVVGLENPPVIEYYNNPKDEDFGGFNPDTNTLSINEHMLYQSDEAADTVAHVLWHA